MTEGRRIGLLRLTRLSRYARRYDFPPHLPSTGVRDPMMPKPGALEGPTCTRRCCERNLPPPCEGHGHSRIRLHGGVLLGGMLRHADHYSGLSIFRGTK